MVKVKVTEAKEHSPVVHLQLIGYLVNSCNDFVTCSVRLPSPLLLFIIKKVVI